MNPKKEREGLFKHLGTVLDVSEKKFQTFNKTDNARLKWGRLIVQAVNSYGKLLESAELEERVEKLEQQLKDGVLIPRSQ